MKDKSYEKATKSLNNTIILCDFNNSKPRISLNLKTKRANHFVSLKIVTIHNSTTVVKEGKFDN